MGFIKITKKPKSPGTTSKSVNPMLPQKSSSLKMPKFQPVQIGAIALIVLGLIFIAMAIMMW